MSLKTLHKRSKNPGAVDSWLEVLGYYRKNVAYDETCLFRAASEQIYLTQHNHEKVRMECIEFARNNIQRFEALYNGKEGLHNRLNNLQKHMIVCGALEIEMLSLKYKREVIIFDGTKFQMGPVTDNNFKDTLLLCRMGDDHYDTIYKKENIQNQGFCQSIVYNIVYTHVFNIPNVEEIVNSMLYDKQSTAMKHTEFFYHNKEKYKEKYLLHQETENESEVTSNDENAQTGTQLMAPFPFKVAKALDPNIYRNIEYDTWTEIRRELRLGDWYYGGANLTVGVRCILLDDHETYHCYIQELGPTSVVYIEELAEKRNVSYEQLSPIPHARAWPLPYRFCRGFDRSPTVAVPEKERRNSRRHRKNIVIDKRIVAKPIDVEADVNISTCVGPEDGTVPPLQEVVNDFEGYPLQMVDVNATQEVDNNHHHHQMMESKDLDQTGQDVSSLLVWEPPINNEFYDSNEAVAQDHQLQDSSTVSTPPSVNWAAKSVFPNGSDLPYHDVECLRFFYNFGVDSFNRCTYNPVWTNVDGDNREDCYESYDGSLSGKYYNVSPLTISTPQQSLSYSDGYTSSMSTPNSSMPTSPECNYSPPPLYPINSPHILYSPQEVSEYIPHSPVLYNPQYVTSSGFIYPPPPPPTNYSGWNGTAVPIPVIYPGQQIITTNP